MKKNDDVTVRYASEQEPLVLFKTTFERLKSQPNWSDPLALYCLYYYTAKWQGDSSIARCSNRYAAKVLGGPDGRKWSLTRIIKNRRVLERLGLINAIIERDQHGHIVGHFVEVSLLTKTDPEHSPAIRDPVSADVPDDRPVKDAIHRRYFKFAKRWCRIHRDRHPRFYAGNAKPTSDTEIRRAAIELERLVRLDGWGWLDQVKPALLFAIEDGFWGADGNLRTLTRVRAVGRNGRTKFDNIHTQYVRAGKRQDSSSAVTHWRRLPQLSLLTKDKGPAARNAAMAELDRQLALLSDRLAFYDPETGRKVCPVDGEDTSHLKGPGRWWGKGKLFREFDGWAAKRIGEIGYTPAMTTIQSWLPEFVRAMENDRGCKMT